MQIKDLIDKVDKEQTRLELKLGIKKNSFGINIEPNIDLNLYNSEELILIHSMLHLFYNTNNRILTKGDIEQIHTRIVPLIEHENFDKLDVNKNA